MGGWFFPLKRDDSMIELSGQVAKCLGKIRKRGGIEAILIQILHYWQILLCYCESQVSMVIV